MSNKYVLTAASHHGRCFICNRTGKLHRINPKSINYGYVNHRIFIKYHARCCRLHLDETKMIKPEEYFLIPTSPQPVNNQTKIMIDLFLSSSEQSGIFDRFKNLTQITDEECFRITRWSREKFMLVCDFIKSIKDTSGRTKEQLLAIYRYWLKKGTDQASLALLKNNSYQREICYYLMQIRTALNRDFVPFFLGVNRSREFFLKHNNTTSIVLHDLKPDDLAIVVDGSYTRIEKSANNKFQYNTWSGQKKDLLIKPFIMCCTDSYIIDCYGPFMGHQNDAQILEYILKTDTKLGDILLPNKTVIFLDRGKLDVYNKDDFLFI